jgi:hypothetical protein
MTALINSGFAFTFGRTTINLAPADVKKEGPSFDLPCSGGCQRAYGQRPSHESRIGRRLRDETTLSLKWVASPLQMGSWTYVSNLLAEKPKTELYPKTPYACFNSEN